MIKKKFDVAVGNPPYQAPKNKKIEKSGTCGTILWDKFLELSINICAKNGYISLVHPGQWRKPEHKLLNTIKKYNLLHLEIYGEKEGIKNFKSDTGYDWYVLQKKDYNKKTVIRDLNSNIIELNIDDYPFIPNSDLFLFKNILTNKQELNIICDSSYHHQRKDITSFYKNDIFKYPCIYGITIKDGLKFYYSKSNKKGHFGVKKIIIPLSRHTTAYIDYEGEYGLCEFAFGIEIKDKEEGEKIKQALMSEKFKKVWSACEWIYAGKEWRMFKYFKKDFWKEFI